jgi:hypothetical protein
MIVLASLLAFSQAIYAQKPAVVVSDKTGWHKIGETTVDFSKESDEVDVMLADKFASLKFKVTDAPIELMDLDVVYEDGVKQNISIGYSIKAAGESSKEIDIKGAGEKAIDKILFRYRTLPNRKEKKAHVEIYGKKTNVDKQMKKEEKKEMKKEAKEEKRERKADKS